MYMPNLRRSLRVSNARSGLQADKAIAIGYALSSKEISVIFEIGSVPYAASDLEPSIQSRKEP